MIHIPFQYYTTIFRAVIEEIMMLQRSLEGEIMILETIETQSIYDPSHVTTKI